MHGTSSKERNGGPASGLNHMLAAFLATGLVLVASLAGLLSPIDDALRALRFEATNRAPSGDIVFLEIDAESLGQVGVWPWPRTIHADVIDRLMEAGAAEVVFDIDFSTVSTEAGDKALEDALERAGGYVLLAAFQQIGADGRTVLNRPLQRFARYSDSVLVNVDGDGTGLLTSLPIGLREPAIPSVAAAFVPDAAGVGEGSLIIDYGIDLRAVTRVPVASFLAGKVDASVFEGKQVIVGASAIELRDFFRVPRFGVISGAMVQLGAAETLKAKRLLVDDGAWPALAMLAAMAVAFAVGHRRLNMGQAMLLGIVAMAGMEIAAWLLQRDRALLIDTAAFHWGIVLLVVTKLVLERAMRWRDYLRQQARLAYLARHDVASGALTHQALLDDIASRLEADEATGVVVVHLDRLDGTIASLGHDIGDRVAAQMVIRLEQELATKPARIGFDQFAWSFDEALSAEQQAALCARVATQLDVPYLVDGHRIMLETRYGVAVATRSGTSGGELLRQADVALLQARERKAQMATYDEAQGQRIAERRDRDIALRQALERGEFSMLYQPQHDLRTGKLIGVEALVRWQNEEMGLVPPDAFIPLAEETGLIVELGAWILMEACLHAAQWDWDGRLSVNVSSQQFLLGDVVGAVGAALAASGLPPERLDIEITESLFIDDDEAVLDALMELKQMGVGIALDDFGTGYSSLSFLPRLPVDKLKIDQAFVRSLPNPGLEALVETIVLMAHRLGKRLVAEGIETAAQRDYLARLGCDVGQGYFFGRPSRLEDLGLVRHADAAQEFSRDSGQRLNAG